MKNTVKLFGAALILLEIFLINPAAAIEIKDRNEFLFDVRRDDNIYLNRFSACKKSGLMDLGMSTFMETQWNFGDSEWEKITAGGEIGKYPWEWLYMGQSLQFLKGQVLDYMTFNPGNDSYETVTKLSIYVPVLKNISGDRLNLRFWEEYSYNLERGAAGLNEIGIETIYRLTKNTTVTMGWRHIDRIHNFDTDYVSSSFTLDF